MTDYPRFQVGNSDADTAYMKFNGARVVDLVLALADRRRAVRDRPHADSMQAPWRGIGARIAILAALVLALSHVAKSQDAVRVRGTIERVEGSAYVVRARDGRSLKLSLAANASVAASVRSSLADIKPGIYIGIAAVPQSDGALRALEAHIFDESMRGTAEGHRPWDLLPDSTMTNAVVEEVVRAVAEQTVTLRYRGGEQRIVIPTETTIVTYLPGRVDELRPGAAIFVPAARGQADGTWLAERIMVGRNIDPPQ